MRIVVTNESGLTDKHIKELKKLGSLEIYNDTNKENFAERLHDAEIAVIDCFLTPVTQELLLDAPKLKFFSINSTGSDKVDIVSVKHAGVIASNVPGFSTGSVAELAIGLMFASLRKITEGDRAFRNGLYAVDPGTPEAESFMSFNLEGKTMGVIGVGHIGAKVAQVALGLGMKVLGYNRTPKTISDIEMVSLKELMKTADVVIVCLALNKETSGLITKELIDGMKKTALFVSIASMDIVDQNALIKALNSESIAGAGIDTGDKRYIGVKHVTLTPHIGYNTRESYENMGQIIFENIRAFIEGNPINQI